MRIGDCRTQEVSDKLTEEEITETTFHRTCRIRRGTLERAGSDSFEEDSCAARAVMWDQDAEETKKLTIYLGSGQQRSRDVGKHQRAGKGNSDGHE